MRGVGRLTMVVALLVLGACGEMPSRRGTPPPAVETPAQRALQAGVRAYDDGQYASAEQQLQQALQLGLAAPQDRVVAHKHLAFIYCTSRRVTECETQFRAAKRADPAFTLSRPEAGHPLWGPVWQRVQQP